MSLPFAPPPGLPLPTLDPVATAALVKEYTKTDLSYIVPLIAFVLITFYGLSEFLKWMFPPKKKPASWQEEFIDPVIGRSSAALTTTEIVTLIFKKDPSLAANVEPLLHEMDLVKFSVTKESMQPLVLKTTKLFANTVLK